MKFDWDESKAKINLAKHKVSFEEASEVFSDAWAIEFFDAAHSDFNEQRFITVGFVENRLLRVSYAVLIDENSNEITRIISAREADRYDKERYEYIRKRFDRF